MPPKRTVQRRLTHTSETQFPGCGGVTRSSPDGSKIAFLAYDKKGVQQIFTISPLGGEPVQVTYHPSNVQSCARWSSSNTSIVYIWDNSIVICELTDKPFEQRFKRLTAKSKDEVLNIVWSNDGKTIGFNRSVLIDGGKDAKKQVFIVRL